MQCSASGCGYESKYQCMGRCSRPLCGRHFTWDGASFFTRDYKWTRERGLDLDRLGYNASKLVEDWLRSSGVDPECDACLYARVDSLYQEGDAQRAVAERRQREAEERQRAELASRPARLEALRRDVEAFIASNRQSRESHLLGPSGWPIKDSDGMHLLGDDGFLYERGKRKGRREVQLTDEGMLRKLPGFPLTS